MSVDATGPAAAPTGLTPLSSGPLPLSPLGGWAWAAVVLLGTLFLGYGLPRIADDVAEVTVPPDALVFGSAAVNPAPGWTVSQRTPFSVTLDNKGVVVTFTSTPAAGQSATVRALGVAADMRRAHPQLTVSSDLQSFVTATGDPGELTALAGISQTAIAASIVSAGQAVDVESLGQSTPFGESINDIETMLTSVRILGAGDG